MVRGSCEAGPAALSLSHHHCLSAEFPLCVCACVRVCVGGRLCTHLKAYVAMLGASVELCVAVNVINGRHVMCNQRCDFLARFLIHLVLASTIVLQTKRRARQMVLTKINANLQVY